MEISLIIAGAILMVGGIYLCIRPYVPSVIASYGGLWLLQWSGAVSVPAQALGYWGAMVFLVFTISSLQSPALTKATQGTVPITLTSLAGMVVGLSLASYAALLVGAVGGAVAGGIFFARTPKGAALHFPSKRFLQYLCAKGFPTVVSVSLLGMALMVAVVAIRGAQL